MKLFKMYVNTAFAYEFHIIAADKAYECVLYHNIKNNFSKEKTFEDMKTDSIFQCNMLKDNTPYKDIIHLSEIKTSRQLSIEMENLTRHQKLEVVNLQSCELLYNENYLK